MTNDRYLFRGFHKDENGTETIYINDFPIKGKWVYGNLIHFIDRSDNGLPDIYYKECVKEEYYIQEIEVYCGDCSEGRIEVIPETISQYTGLIDKNGKKIFEKDIIKASYEYKGEYEFKVIYVESSCMYVLENEEYLACYTFEDVCNIEVIGTIFDEKINDENNNE